MTMDRKKKIAEIRKSAEEAGKTDRSWVDGQDYADDVEFLLDELERLEQERNMYKASSEVFYERLKKVDEERDKLIEALRWYADEENQKLDESTRHWENVYSPYEMDGGQRARDILKEIGVTVE